MSPDATLYYGFLLGCPNDGGWEVAEADEFGGLEDAGLPWLEEAEDDGDYETAMRRAILSGAGVETSGVSWSDLNGLLAECCGVEVVHHGSRPSDIMHLGIALAGTVHQADDYTPKAVTLSLEGMSDEPLRSALVALGLTPNQADPSWILAPGEG